MTFHSYGFCLNLRDLRETFTLNSEQIHQHIIYQVAPVAPGVTIIDFNIMILAGIGLVEFPSFSGFLHSHH